MFTQTLMLSALDLSSVTRSLLVAARSWSDQVCVMTEAVFLSLSVCRIRRIKVGLLPISDTCWPLCVTSVNSNTALTSTSGLILPLLPSSIPKEEKHDGEGGEGVVSVQEIVQFIQFSQAAAETKKLSRLTETNTEG